MKSGSNSNPKVKYKCRTLDCFVLNWYRIYFGLKYCWVYMVFWLYAVCSHSVTTAAVTAAVSKSDRRLTQLFCTNYLFHSMWHFVKRRTITQKYQRKIKSWNHWTLQKSPLHWKSRIAATKNFPICDSISSILVNWFMHSRYSAFAAMWKPTKSHTYKNAHTYLFAQILRSVYCSANDSITWWNSRHEHFSSGFSFIWTFPLQIASDATSSAF